jgi:hypothetical protein
MTITDTTEAFFSGPTHKGAAVTFFGGITITLAVVVDQWRLRWSIELTD